MNGQVQLRDEYETKVKLTSLRVEEQNVKAEGPDKLGIETITTDPQDIELMFAAKMALEMLEQKVRVDNIGASFRKSYKITDEKQIEVLDEYSIEFTKDKTTAEKNLIRICKKHPLTKKLIGIKGLGAYSMGLIMGLMKAIKKVDDKGNVIPKFRTPSALMVYAGLGVKYGMKVSLRNMNRIREIHYQKEGNRDFGFNTKLSGRMHCIGESLIKGRGYFKNMYDDLRTRLTQRAINNNECFIATAQDEIDSKGKMEAGRHYMNNRENQSVEIWSHSNAKVRIQRTVLHLIYREWMLYECLIPRQPYPIQYLGMDHGKAITLKDVLAYDLNHTSKNKKRTTKKKK